MKVYGQVCFGHEFAPTAELLFYLSRPTTLHKVVSTHPFVQQAVYYEVQDMVRRAEYPIEFFETIVNTAPPAHQLSMIAYDQLTRKKKKKGGGGVFFLPPTLSKSTIILQSKRLAAKNI